MVINLTPQQEAERILAIYGQDQQSRIMELLERQFAILHNRSQVLLGLCGVVITTTGFSGRLIAGTSATAQAMIIIGVTLTLVAAVMVVCGVLHLRWLTQQPGEAIRPWLMTCLAYRDRKTRFYRVGIYLMLIGLAFYVVAIALMLSYPGAAGASALPLAR